MFQLSRIYNLLQTNQNAHMVLSGHLSNTTRYFGTPKKISVQIYTSYKSQVKPNEDKSLNQFEK